MAPAAAPLTALLGLPRIGRERELKVTLERRWRGECGAAELGAAGAALRADHLRWAADAGIDVIPCNDFSLYDHVLDTAVMVGAVPERFRQLGLDGDDVLFAMARGAGGAAPLGMTKWFDTNYHHLVPEIEPGTAYALDAAKPLRELGDAHALGIPARPVLLGPFTFLRLARAPAGGPAPLDTLDGLLAVYEQLLVRLHAAGATAVQVDEPCLVRDLDATELAAVERAWERLAAAAPGLELTLATYFGGLGAALGRILRLPAAEVHLDLVSAPEQLGPALDAVAPGRRLSLGVIDGRNVWRADLAAIAERVAPAIARLGADRIRLAPSCSLLHVPYAAARETGLDPQLRSWLAFADEKLAELATLRAALAAPDPERERLLAPAAAVLRDRRGSERVRDPAVRARLARLPAATPPRASSPAQRAAAQAARLALPELPTTTIGSLPQTPEIRAARRDRAAGVLDDAGYERFLEDEIARDIALQERIGLDVLVHGEPERNDMVQYFAERLAGFATTEHGWVQSYGSRCVRPPVLYGDVSRAEPITVRWWRHAQACTDRPVKAILTGPVTFLRWSFVRDDEPHEAIARQLGGAIGDEARELQEAGAAIVQIDEAALREGLPLRAAERPAYLRWAVESFRLATAGLDDATQVHVHMCYSDVGDIAEAIAAMGADVVSVEAARSGIRYGRALAGCPCSVGPGIYDVHAPRVPSREELEALLADAERWIPRERLWVNPDCGLKTRDWDQVVPALERLVAAARHRREAPAPAPGASATGPLSRPGR